MEEWEHSQDTLKERHHRDGQGLMSINEGDGAFYGPKLDFHLADSLGRTWQCGTIQLDFQLPERFELEYTGEDGEKHRPVMIHRVVLGSIERFIGVITEHFAGAFPTWLAPVQVKVLPITDRAADYADQVAAKLDDAGLPGGDRPPQREDRLQDPRGPAGEGALYAGGGRQGGRDRRRGRAQPPRRADRHELRRLCRQAQGRGGLQGPGAELTFPRF